MDFRPPLKRDYIELSPYMLIFFLVHRNVHRTFSVFEARSVAILFVEIRHVKKPLAADIAAVSRLDELQTLLFKRFETRFLSAGLVLGDFELNSIGFVRYHGLVLADYPDILLYA